MANTLRVLQYGLKLYLFGAKFPTSFSVDVTNKCNLRCKHCYFWQQEHPAELGEEELLIRINEIKSKYPSIMHASWVGGEPLLRKGVVEKGMKLFPFNMVVTNGSLELPKWKNCVFNISVDGTREVYKKVRGIDIYDDVKMHADREDIRVNIACVINKINQGCIEDLVKEWSDTNVRSIIFDFYTPIEGIGADLWVDWKDRDEIIDRIHALKKQYGKFVLNSKSILELMRPDNAKAFIKNCPLPENAVSLDSMGNRKSPCILGENADCSRCGCIVPYFVKCGLMDKKLDALISGMRALV